MTIKDIINLKIPEEFGPEEEDPGSYAIDQVIDQLDDTVYAATGASKFVIVFKNEDYVVKIPFNGCFYYAFEEDAEDEGGYYWDDNCELYFNYYDNTNYCDVEVNIYKDAAGAGLDPFFAATFFAGKTANGCPYYKQEKIYFSSQISDKLTKPSGDSLKKAENSFSKYHLDSYWLARAYEWYGDRKVNAFLRFIKEKKINDLRDENIGYRADGSPCLADFSGFYS